MMKVSTKEPRKKSAGPRKVVLRALEIYESPYAPLSMCFDAVIFSVSSKKRTNGKVERIFGYLPSYSPAIEYFVTLDEENKIIMRESWTRHYWWLTRDAVKNILKDYLQEKQSMMISQLFVNTKCKEEDIDLMKENKKLHMLFTRHFWEDIWFDIAMLLDEKKSRNLYSPYMLEKFASRIRKWQNDLDNNLTNGLLISPLEIPNITWNEVIKLLQAAKLRMPKRRLTDNDIDHETMLMKRLSVDRTLLNRQNTEIPLVYPPMPVHGYDLPDDAVKTVFTFRQLGKQRLKYGDTCFTSNALGKEAEELMKRVNILYDIGRNQWTFSKHVLSSSIINNLFCQYYVELGRAQNLNTLDDAMALPLSLVLTRGHNMFNIFRLLVDKMDEEKIHFVCPNRDAAKIFLKEVGDVMPEPLGPATPAPKIVIFCFAHMFSFNKLASFLIRFNNMSESSRPKKYILFGDPDILQIKGVGCPFSELLDSGRVNYYHLQWTSQESENIYSIDVKKLVAFLGENKSSKGLPWSENIQLCEKQQFHKLYNELLTMPSVEDYHILCDSYEEMKSYVPIVRSAPPRGFRTSDKVWVPERCCMDIVYKTFPLNNKGLKEEPPNVVKPDKRNHCAILYYDQYSDHKKCCGTSFVGQYRLCNHEFDWATIQNFRENKVPLRKHIVIILSEHTNKKHLYSACMMAKDKLTIVGTLKQLDNAMSKTGVQRRVPLLLEYTINPSNRIN